MSQYEATASLVEAFNGALEGKLLLPRLFEINDSNEYRVADLIGPQIFKLQPCSLPDQQSFRATRPFYVCNAYQGPALKLDVATGSYYLVDLSATVAWSIPNWFVNTGDDKRRHAITDRMLDDLFGKLFVKQNELVLSLLTKIVRLERRVTAFDESRDTYEGTRRGKKMLHPMEPTPNLLAFFDARPGIVEYDERAVDDLYEGTIEYDHSERTLAFEFDARQEFGRWAFDDERAKVIPWINGENLTLGLSGYVNRGIVVTNPDSLRAVDFAPYVEKVGKRQRLLPADRT